LIITEALVGRTESQLEAILSDLDYVYFWITTDGLVERKRIEADPSYASLNYFLVGPDRLPQIRRDFVVLADT
jgi:hypothetical protein